MKNTTVFVYLLLVIMSCNNNLTPETHVLPDNYTGQVVIFFKSTKVNNAKKIVYNIPENGVLLSDNSENIGSSEINCLLFTYRNNEKIPIWNIETKDSNVVSVWLHRNGSCGSGFKYEYYYVDKMINFHKYFINSREVKLPCDALNHTSN